MSGHRGEAGNARPKRRDEGKAGLVGVVLDDADYQVVSRSNKLSGGLELDRRHVARQNAPA